MIVDSKPLSLYQSFNDFHLYMRCQQIPLEIILTIKECYIALFHKNRDAYDVCNTKIDNDFFPIQLYRQLKLLKDYGMGDYKVGGSAALKLASADDTWENDDVDIMIYTQLNPRMYATALGLNCACKSWTKGIDPMNSESEERFHESIFQVLTFQHPDFDKKIQLVFFEKFYNLTFTSFLDTILDYPAHVLYEVDFDAEEKMTYNFFLPVKMWDSILQKRIPKNLHCLKSSERIEKYVKRGFEFFEI